MRSTPWRWILLLAAALATLGGDAVACTAPAAVGSGRTSASESVDRSPPADDRAPQQEPAMTIDDHWRRLDALIDEQKYQAALELADELLGTLRGGAAEEWVRALIEVVQLETALHGYETAVRRLYREPWPEEPLARTVLDLYTAAGLTTYLSIYGWEIEQRERVVGDEEVDLGLWTSSQILAAVDRALADAWQGRVALGEQSVAAARRYLTENNYPDGVRSTMRDALTYFWVDLLADSSRWTPRESNELYLLDLAALIAGGGSGDDSIDVPPRAGHPLEKIGALLADLESWHRLAGRPEAALEARLERLRRLTAAFSDEGDRRLLRAELERLVAAFDADLEWWSVAVAELAELQRRDSEPWALAVARQTALAGIERHPTSIGGRRLRHLVAQIEAPDYSLTAMASDGLDRRSVEVRHKNLMRLFFRAYPIDLVARVESSTDFDLLYSPREIEEVVASTAPAFEWSVELPPTPDYRRHRTFVVPQIERPGMYLIVASARPEFAAEANRLEALWLNLTDLVLLSRPGAEGLDVTVRSGDSGRPVAGAAVSLYRFDYRRGHRRKASRTTDGAGRVHFRPPDPRGNYFVIAEKDDQVALDPQSRLARQETDGKEQRSALVYTDRSVYRPRQGLLWKVVAYGGTPDDGRFATLPRQSLSVELIDANGEVVESVATTTNDFGSVSGSFEIPAGRLLGAWRLRTSLGGGAGVRVEEYKRPTFEVTLAEPAEALRLNREARISAEARFYFGLPVAAGEARWRVTREPVYPLWRRWWDPPPSTGAQTIAAGRAELGRDGRVEVRFVPQADEREALDGISYRFRASIEVTAEGGETRTADRTFRVGFTAVEAIIETERGFFAVGEPATVSVRRVDLDGAPRSGAGEWRVVALEQPQTTLLPADVPLPAPANAAGERPRYRTPGDHLRPRWEPPLAPERLLGDWPEGAELARGRVEHGEDGVATLRLPALGAGAYRLVYETLDRFGTRFEARQELVVVGDGGRLALPIVLIGERSAVGAGERARFLVHTGIAGQELLFELFRGGRLLRSETLAGDEGPHVIEVPIVDEYRGGLGARVTGIRDHQRLALETSIFVPWSDRELEVSFTTFRDRLQPGENERWSVLVTAANAATLATGMAEIVAYMYDRSLDLFAPHQPPDPLTLYPRRGRPLPVETSLGWSQVRWREGQLASLPGYRRLRGDRLTMLSGYGIGGMGRRYMARAGVLLEAMAMPAPSAAAEERIVVADAETAGEDVGDVPTAPAPELRSDFAETAFWEPHLRLADDGSVALEFSVPDTLTEWSIWVHALTRDLAAGRLERRAATAKELMVRPYLPRFLRQGDHVEIRVAVDNAGETDLVGRLDLAVEDAATGSVLTADFGLDAAAATGVPFRIAPGEGVVLPFRLEVPADLRPVAVRAVARAGNSSDGELRPLPVLPGRMNLAQSRFAALRDGDRRDLVFEQMATGEDPTLLHEQLVVTLEAQLFYGVLKALPYLVEYPYECTEQILNRFLSTGILATLYDDFPAVKRMASEFSERETRFEPWEAVDPNRKMALEETPWLALARGGRETERLVNVLSPRVARAQRRSSLAKLERAQTASGGFPWWPGGPPSPYMTLYLLSGLSRALEFGIEVPKPMVQSAWRYLHRHYVDELERDAAEDDCCWEMVTFLNYVLSSYPDESWTGEVFSADDRRRMLELSFAYWKEHPPLVKGYLTLTLARSGRADDARLVFDSVMDSARSERDLGTFWAPEERGWLWYNDTIESHAFALRVLTELAPNDVRRHGLVQWLFLNKQLNHWKSTRATAEVVYALVHYLGAEGSLGSRESVEVSIGQREPRVLVFEPDEYTGENVQILIAGDELEPETDHRIAVGKETPGLLFASATWHFSTEQLPQEAAGDLFSVTRRYFKRELIGDEWTLIPVDGSSPLAVGDQVEVHLEMRAAHAAEYVHLRDPRPAGFEPETLTSGHGWDLGLLHYEEVRDSGTNFFFEWLPAGTHTLKYRLRANLDGRFRAAPARLQSMYAPEFAAHSAGDTVAVGE